MSDTTLHHVPAPGTASFRDVGTGPNQIIALSSSPGTADGSKFLRDDGVLSNPTGERGPAGIPNPEVGQDLGDSGAAFTVPDMDEATAFVVTLTAAGVVPTFPTLTSIEVVPSFLIVVKQDATGGRTWAPTALWPGGAQPGLSTAPNAVDVFSFLGIFGVGWLGFAAGYDFS